MNSELRVIGLMFFVLLLAACSKDGDSPENTQPVINVYVYSPEHPMITRGDIGNVAAIDNTLNESLIKTLQIWVFEHGTENLVSYYSPETVRNLNEEKSVTYQLNVSEAFAKAKPKPTVDVYVVANAASCGLSLPQTICRDRLEDLDKADLEHAMIKKSGTIDYFGLEDLTKKVPEDGQGNPIGLPMSGVLRDVAVTGSAPVFKISSVKLTRAVSKLRFIFSRDDAKEIKINSIKLGGERTGGEKILTIATEEYLFLPIDNSLYHVGSSYADSETEFLSSSIESICKNNDPIKYTYQSGQNAQDYENLIAEALSKETPELTQVGPFYLRETDKKLAGTIRYQVEKTRSQQGQVTEWDTEKVATFEMKTAGDFSRNHTWIVYAYYGVDGMKVESVYSQDWNEVTTKDVHNWYNW